MKHALLRTLAGRTILIGLAVRVADFLLGLVLGPLPLAFAVVDAIAALAIAAGGTYFLVRGLATLNRRLLWRVRHKLVISYMVIGLVPTLLIVLFFVIGGVLLFFNFSAYMVRSEFRGITERARSMAHGVALEIERSDGRDIPGILTRQQATFSQEFTGLSIEIVPTERHCAESSIEPEASRRPVPARAVMGPWAHVEPPAEIPGWIGCDGFSGVFLYSQGAAVPADSRPVVRAVTFPESRSPEYAVIVDIDINPGVRSELRRAIGVQLENVIAWDETGDPPAPKAPPLVGRAPRATETLAPTPAIEAVPPLPSITYLEYRDWATGSASRLTLNIRLGVGEVYGKISAAPGAGNIVIFVLEIVGGLFLVVEMVALAYGVALARSITGSVHELFTGTELVRRGDFTHKIEVKADDQLGELARSFNSMTASIEDLLRESAEKKRLEEELRIAHEIQMSLLPQGQLRMEGLSVAAACVPAREVGGDYYDFLRLDEHRLGVLIADVSGKGTSAALYMAEFKGLILSLSRIHTSPRELLIQANRIIAPHLDARSFITVTYAVFDLRTRTMTYARAGHTPLISLPAGARTGPGAQILAPSGMVLGLKIDRGEVFERVLDESVIPLKNGDLYVFFTDGITEAMTRQDEFFGDERLAKVIEAHAHLPVEELRERVLREVAAFVGDAPQHDDMTVILLRVDDTTRGDR
jgi:sigma-B regulation protein RsbU (phosphoserine phosphatase)